MNRDVLRAWRDGICHVDTDMEFQRRFWTNKEELAPEAWLDLASLYVARHEIGQADWADCIDKAVLLCCRSMYLVGRQADFFWWSASNRYEWSEFLERDGTYAQAHQGLRTNAVRTAAQTRSAYAPSSQPKNLRFFRPDGTLTEDSIYDWGGYEAAGQSFGAGEPSRVHDNLPPLAREPWGLPLRPGDVLVFDFRWHGAGNYSGHVPTIGYFDPEEGLLAVVEDHLPKGGSGMKQPSESDAYLYTRDGTVDFVPGFKPEGGENLFRGMARWGCGGIFHVPAHSPSGLVFDQRQGRLEAIGDRKEDITADPDRFRGANWAGFVGFARYACR